ncbi:hypothetical protein [Kluyvera ascorbata]|uniref:hypothetical protein n=1 Tax=Kluyvera ascorbata TaxID=51288 RepID=UPI002900CE68|nr:hypothetical protein [Kluyvera ascorbata]MDU1196834.1 hypothetical protein [Kluyvera ascorbata]
MIQKNTSLNLSVLSALFIAPNANLIARGIIACSALFGFSAIAAVWYSVISPPDYQSSLYLIFFCISLVAAVMFYVFLYLYGDDL